MTNRKSLWLATLLVGLLYCGPTVAIDYQIEVVLFETLPTTDDVRRDDLHLPNIKSAIGLNSGRAQALNYARVEDNLQLTESAEKIKRSSRYRLLRHFAWRQPGLNQQEAVPISINLGQSLTVFVPSDVNEERRFIPASFGQTAEYNRQVVTSTVAGSIRVWLGRFLHVESHLVYTDSNTGNSYRLRHDRKMRSRELHYIDNPRFGFLIRILPIENSDS